MEVVSSVKALTNYKNSCQSLKLIVFLFLVLIALILLHIQASPFYSISSPSSTSWDFLNKWKQTPSSATNPSLPTNPDRVSSTSKAMDPVTLLPLKDLRFAETAMDGNTWFMSSLNDTHEENEALYLYFPSQASLGRLLCLKGRDTGDGTKNLYGLASPKNLPESATLLKGLTFVSDTYYDYANLWHAICAVTPFVGWSLKNGCLRPTRWVLFHWGELRNRMGLWIQKVMQANFGEVQVEGFEGGDGPYCFEKAVVMRHNDGGMGKEKKLQVFDLLRCKARGFCGVNPLDRGKEVNENGEPIIRLTLLMRRGSRSFKNVTAVTHIFAKECAKVGGCMLKVAQSEDLSFCDQVRVMTETDILASPHGAQLTNMLFMDRNSSVMEFFPKGWLELAGIGQYAHHWMAAQSGIIHQGAWWDPQGEKECPFPRQDPRCFMFYKDGNVGHNETYFAEWATRVINQVRLSKLEQTVKNSFTATLDNSGACVC